MNATNPTYSLRCLNCHVCYDPKGIGYCCPACGEAGALDTLYDYRSLASQLDRDALASRTAEGMWRFNALLPQVAPSFRPGLLVGNTPLYRRSGLIDYEPGLTVWIKDESRQPTGSLKDRASALAVGLALQADARVIAVASTGNAASALAGMAADRRLHTVIYVPRTTPSAKLAQMTGFGAEVVLVDGAYDEAFDQCQQACNRHGWYNRTTGINSYMTEGKKTVAFEIAEQTNWVLPELIFVPVGNGCILGSVFKGFFDLLQMGWIERMPRLIGVQAEASNFLYRAWRSEGPMDAVARVAPSSRASSINVAFPRDRLKAMRAVRATDGEFICVSDQAIADAAQALAARTGVFAEAGAAAAYAGLRQWVSTHPGEAASALLLITGSGLKDTQLYMCGDTATSAPAIQHQPV
ncbi:MAG: threonine synthase [Pseudomonas sp. PGPPP4]|uniref:threonine synthase n=1 Tax=Pseudomonas sp. PGPPP4 TaxID=2015556 RepID=UPI000BD171AB|nr:pyridoxal-phosphate dependent enzyme [Pseudomonas sp. PGPPP4]OYT83167.1 MAG: threonine synthase [Pseudomonas sp. PGPPP4]